MSFYSVTVSIVVIFGVLVSGYATPIDDEFELAGFDDDEIMKPIEEANEQAVPNGFLLTVTPGSTDESNSAGTYVVFPKPGVVGSLIIRKKRVFINKEKRRIAFYNGSRFVITSTSYTTVVLLGATGGLYRSQPTVHPFVRGKWGPVYDMKPLYVR